MQVYGARLRPFCLVWSGSAALMSFDKRECTSEKHISATHNCRISMQAHRQ